MAWRRSRNFNHDLVYRYFQEQKELSALKIISSLLEKQSEVESAYLFGSVAVGTERKESDMDIAVRLDDRLTAEEMGRSRFDLVDLMEYAVGRKIDLVILNTASLKLIHQVLTYGKRFYANNMEKERAFEVRKRQEYFDFKYYIDRDIQEMCAFYAR